MPLSEEPRQEHSYTLITGASSGIGLALAGLMAAKGHSLVLVVRDKAGLETFLRDTPLQKGQEIRIVEADLADPAAPNAIFTQVAAWGIWIDILVNNAGFGLSGAFYQQAPETVMEMVGVNIVALTQLTRLFLPSMMQQGKGRIMNVSSVAAFQPGPGMAVYFASKAYVLHFSEAIRYELRSTGVTVTTLCPGPTVSGFWQRAGMAGFRSPMGMASAEAVAGFGYRSMMNGRRVAVYGSMNQLMAVLGRLLPIRLATAMIGRFMG